MKIETPQENKIVVELSAADLAELDITYEEMDYANIETRRVIWTILDKARHTLCRDIDPAGKMLIETIPTAEGGCVICFTVLGAEMKSAQFRHMRLSKEPTTITYAFDSLNALTDCAESLRAGNHTLPKSSLYLVGNEYRLRLQNSRPNSRCKSILSEYGTPCPDHALSLPYLQEHGKLLCEGDAIEKLTLHYKSAP